jgi:hypothetical protein
MLKHNLRDFGVSWTTGKAQKYHNRIGFEISLRNPLGFEITQIAGESVENRILARGSPFQNGT